MISTGRIGRTWAANYTTALRLPLHPSMGPPNTPYPAYDQNQNDAGSLDNYDHINQDEYHPLSHAALSFVHGGLSPTYSNLSPFPTRINELSAALLRKLQHRKQPPPHPPYPYPGLPPSKGSCVSLSCRLLSYWLSGTTEEEEEMYSSNGPLWYRGWALHSEEQVCEQVEEVLKKTGTRRMIMGHTPDFEVRCQPRLLCLL